MEYEIFEHNSMHQKIMLENHNATEIAKAIKAFWIIPLSAPYGEKTGK